MDGLANGYDLRDSSTIKLHLVRKAFHAKHGFPWVSCAPFVDNDRGSLIHRPKSGCTYNTLEYPHVAVNFWCGMTTTSPNGKNLSFLSAPPEGRVLCERCEAIAVANGLPSADDLSGRHVHKGRTVAVATCCAAIAKAGG